MCRGEKYFSAISYSTYDPLRKFQCNLTYTVGLSVVSAQPVQKGASIRILAVV